MVSAQFWEKNTAFCVYLVHVKYWCVANSNLAYFIELTTTLECQKQLLMSSISNLGCRKSREIAVTWYQMFLCLCGLSGLKRYVFDILFWVSKWQYFKPNCYTRVFDSHIANLLDTQFNRPVYAKFEYS